MPSLEPGFDPAPELRTAEARESASEAAADAGVTVRLLNGIDELTAGVNVLNRVWAPTGSEVSPVFLRSLEHAGNYVSGAFIDNQLCGVSIGFFSAPDRRTLHSHVTGIVDTAKGRGVGRALKLHQRAWALERHVTTITWTYDPLVTRNAYFNLMTLRARVTDYIVDFYGHKDPTISSGEPTDRFLVAWDLLGSLDPVPLPDLNPELDGTEQSILQVSPQGTPSTNAAADPSEHSRLLIGIPPNVEAMRTDTPALALKWQLALREALVPLLDGGWTVDRFLKDGLYVLVRDER